MAPAVAGRRGHVMTTVSAESVSARVSRRRVAVRLPTLAWFATFVLVVAGVSLTFSGALPDKPSSPNVVFVPLFTVMVESLATVGALLALRRSENPIGWLLLTGGVLMSVAVFGSAYLQFSFVCGRELPGAAVIGWLP